MNASPIFAAAFAAAALVTSAAAQNPGEGPDPSPQLHSEIDSWRAAHGESWDYYADEQTGYARFLYNGTAEALFEPRTDADWFALARTHLDGAYALLGIESETLVDDYVRLLPLAQIGSTDKMTVRFDQRVDGVPVIGGGANVLMALDGTLLSLDTTGMPEAAALATSPTRDSGDANAIAVGAFVDETGLAPTFVSEPTLAVLQERVGKIRIPTLVWRIDVLWSQPDYDPEGTTYSVAARGTSRVVATEPLIHHFDVGGTVQTMATPGTKPDLTSNPPIPFPAKYLTVTSSAGTTTTDANGFFNFVGASGPLQCTFRYQGTYNNVTNQGGPAYSLTTSLATGTSNSVMMNPFPSQLQTSQSNAFTHVNTMRDWTVTLNPSDLTTEFVCKADCNISSNCNAYYDGTSINFYTAGGGCVNTSYSTVIAHEEGHWLNVKYNSGNGSDGFGEGNADVFAMYLFDNPIVGENFSGGGIIRTGTNNRQYCGDTNPGCYGAVHTDGEVLMGVLWKVRANLNTTYGDATGDLIADILFNSWMNAYDDGNIHSIIETHWLTLDDDDGTIANGSPHYAEIDAGFVTQGFPGHQLSFVAFTNVIQPTDTQDEAGPYGIAVDLAPVFGSAITSATLHYSVSGGAFQTQPLIPATGSTWTTLLPGVPSPADVDFYLSASDDLANSETWPSDAPASTLSFRIGLVNSFFFDDFESVGDNGWTSAQIQTQNDWHHEDPKGKTGTSSGVSWQDPTVAYSGTQHWGNDLGRTGWNGSYKPSVWNELYSPTIDLSSAVGTTLEFQRWLSVEEGQFDQATILVNGVQVWQNPFSGHVLETAWGKQSIDISAVADGVAATTLEWRMQSDGGMELGGWNIDDVELLSFEPSPSTCMPVNYGSGLVGTIGTPLIDSGGQQSMKGNADFAVKVKNGLPGATSFIGLGFSQISVPVFGGTALVNPLSITVVPLDLFGQTTMAAPIPDDLGLVGLNVYFQAFVVDGGAPQGFAMTSGLQATICP